MEIASKEEYQDIPTKEEHPEYVNYVKNVWGLQNDYS